MSPKDTVMREAPFGPQIYEHDESQATQVLAGTERYTPDG
jgi:hypothetical protein